MWSCDERRELWFIELTISLESQVGDAQQWKWAKYQDSVALKGDCVAGLLISSRTDHNQREMVDNSHLCHIEAGAGTQGFTCRCCAWPSLRRTTILESYRSGAPITHELTYLPFPVYMCTWVFVTLSVLLFHFGLHSCHVSEPIFGSLYHMVTSLCACKTQSLRKKKEKAWCVYPCIHGREGKRLRAWVKPCSCLYVIT